jgi:uncharacterized protein (DUF342 family)
MFTKTQIETSLDAEIQTLLKKLSETTDKTSDEYSKLLEKVSKLHKLKAEEKPKFRPSPDTVLMVAANIAGILWLARFEKTDVIKAPKAFGNIMKIR